MTPDQIRAVLLEEIGNIAPEAELSRLDPNADIREELDIDSISFLNLITALHNRLGIVVPEGDYPKLAKLAEAISYLSAKIEVS